MALLQMEHQYPGEWLMQKLVQQVSWPNCTRLQLLRIPPAMLHCSAGTQPTDAAIFMSFSCRNIFCNSSLLIAGLKLGLYKFYPNKNQIIRSIQINCYFWLDCVKFMHWCGNWTALLNSRHICVCFYNMEWLHRYFTYQRMFCWESCTDNHSCNRSDSSQVCSDRLVLLHSDALHFDIHQHLCKQRTVWFTEVKTLIAPLRPAAKCEFKF